MNPPLHARVRSSSRERRPRTLFTRGVDGTGANRSSLPELISGMSTCRMRAHLARVRERVSGGGAVATFVRTRARDSSSSDRAVRRSPARTSCRRRRIVDLSPPPRDVGRDPRPCRAQPHHPSGSPGRTRLALSSSSMPRSGARAPCGPELPTRAGSRSRRYAESPPRRSIGRERVAMRPRRHVRGSATARSVASTRREQKTRLYFTAIRAASSRAKQPPASTGHPAPATPSSCRQHLRGQPAGFVGIPVDGPALTSMMSSVISKVTARPTVSDFNTIPGRQMSSPRRAPERRAERSTRCRLFRPRPGTCARRSASAARVARGRRTPA